MYSSFTNKECYFTVVYFDGISINYVVVTKKGRVGEVPYPIFGWARGGGRFCFVTFSEKFEIGSLHEINSYKGGNP